MRDFNTGFTNKSYFHIIKSIVEGIYERNFDIRKQRFGTLMMKTYVQSYTQDY